MSAIAGMVDWRGQPIGSAVKKAMAALYLHGRDGEGFWDGGDIALGWRQSILHEEDFADGQPLAGGEGRFRVVFDGRIDNRDELRRALSLSPDQARAWPDSRYVLAAFEKWKEDCARRLLGDFAFAVWDNAERSLFLAKDHMGKRPLAYHEGQGFFIFASMPSALIASGMLEREIHLDACLRAVALRPTLADHTFFRGAVRLPAGHSLRVQASGIRRETYWRLDQTPDLRLRKETDYVEAFRERFGAAVRSCLRTIHPIGSQLSSGWDSSSVTATAATLLAAEGRSLSAFTFAPPADWKPAVTPKGEIQDESPMAATVAARYPNVRHVIVHGSGVRDFAALDEYAAHFEQPRRDDRNAGWYSRLHHQARQEGTRVMLCGMSGNATISHDGLDLLATLVLKGRLFGLVREWQGLHARGRSHRHLAWMTLLPLLSAKSARRLHYLLNVPSLDPVLCAFVAPDMLQQAQRLARPRTPVRLDAPVHRRHRRRFLLARAEWGTDHIFAGALAAWDVNLRDPTSDQRIMEFCYAVPDEVFLRNGESKWLLRRAMQGVLPEALMSQRARGVQSPDWLRAAFRSKEAMLTEIDRMEQIAGLVALLDYSAIREFLAMEVAAGDPWRVALASVLMSGFEVQRFAARQIPTFLR